MPGSRRLRGLALLLLAIGVGGDESCWTAGVTREFCCNMQLGPQGNTNCWDGEFTFDRCCRSDVPVPRLPYGPSDSSDGYPACIVTDIVLRHSGEHGVFVDVTSHGSTGCFQNNCSYSDKFKAVDRGVCARLCAEAEECTHWAFGKQEGALKCFLRRSDGGREWATGWSAGTKACAPTPLPDAHAALAIAESEGVKACDGGKGESCPDVLAAMRTWLLAIGHLQRAARGRVDQATMGHVDQIATDSSNLVARITGDYRPSDADFPRVVFNNRLIFDSLKDWLASQAKAELSEQDLSLPVPLRTGGLCGGSCYEL